MAKRPFDFKFPAQFEARLRQHGMCAHCGEWLDDLEERAHHVAPNQTGDPADLKHGWLSSADNCVIICYDCHDRVHENANFRFGATAPPAYFPFSHGKKKREHRNWALRLEKLIDHLWA